MCFGVRWAGGRVSSVFAVALAFLVLTAVRARAQTSTLRVNGFVDATGTVTSSPAGISCKTAKFAPTGTCSANFPAGTVVTLTAVPGVQNTFEGWSGGCTGTGDCQVTMTQDIIDVRPNFVATRYPVTILGAGNGSGTIREPLGQGFGTPNIACAINNGVTLTPQQCTGTVAYGSTIELGFSTNVAGTNVFGGFSPECTPFSGVLFPCTATITGPTTITATILAREVRVRSAGGTGTGTVTSTTNSNANINCTITPAGQSGACVTIFSSNEPTQATLVATPGEGSRFVGWSGACTADPCTFFPDYPSNVSDVVARFEALPENMFKLVVNGIGGFGRGHVTSNPAGIECDFSDPAKTSGTGTCLAIFPFGTTVELTADPRDGTKVLGFTGDCASQAATCKVIMYHDRSATVQLEPARFPVTIVPSGSGSGRVFGPAPVGTSEINCTVTGGVASGTGCTSMYPFGSTLQIFGGFEEDSRFDGFSVPPCTVATTCEVMVTGPLSITARFELADASPIALSVAGVGTGRGIVTIAPGSTQCTFTGVVPGDACSVTYGQPTQVTLTASPQFGSTFGGWGGGACSGTDLTCTFTISAATAVSVNFISPHSLHDLALALTGGFTLAPNDQDGLDRLGNRNGQYDLGDLLAYLDRTGQKLSATDAAAAMAAPKAPQTAGTTRRVP